MKNARLPQLVALGAGVMLCALAVISNKHEHRRLTAELEQQRAERDRLDLEWSQLQLEEATLASHARLESLARGRLGMSVPQEPVVVIAGSAP